ncbi:hypothetical protein [Limosilactobacillus equigenerosi]|uniref:LITAF domain-containing protein n=1 Tax=Limosilactobacillus equigenerosi DSM 18793 = JCM 14505 TaxID=1423742 RepID=A0A0R1UKW4_9LACO|nr:hypothetical protein [Limosilactobacillus equigenerosi]KRL93916.1 hypothetical protein FC21_GL001387 [Limosilactobacillus equigenerosi DSM 18793 = JCM 14505]
MKKIVCCICGVEDKFSKPVYDLIDGGIHYDCWCKVTGNERSQSISKLVKALSKMPSSLFTSKIDENGNVKETATQENGLELPKCPFCGSTDLQIMGIDRKGFSVGKAVGGAVLTGGIGLLAGFAGKKTGKTDYYCNDCHNQCAL